MSTVGQALNEKELSVKERLEDPQTQVKRVEVSEEPTDEDYPCGDGISKGFVAETIENGDRHEYMGRVTESGGVSVDREFSY